MATRGPVVEVESGGEEELAWPHKGGNDEDKPHEDFDDNEDIDEVSKELKADFEVKKGTKVELEGIDVHRPHENVRLG